MVVFMYFKISRDFTLQDQKELILALTENLILTNLKLQFPHLEQKNVGLLSSGQFEKFWVLILASQQKLILKNRQFYYGESIGSSG
jgi:hypothetical protein